MKRNILFGWAIIVTVVLVVIGLRSFMDSEYAPGAIVNYYNPSDLKGMGLPGWNLTKAAPLAPDQAIRSAFEYANKRHPTVVRWDVDSIELAKEIDGIWSYHIFLVDRMTGKYEVEDVRVLMNGSVWQPKSGPR